MRLPGRAWAKPSAVLRRAGLTALVRRTGNFGRVTWLGQPIWQNVNDAWLLQETVVEKQIDLVVECGTNRGGSAFYLASIFDLLGRGHVITLDIEKLHDIVHPRIDFLLGSSTDPQVFASVQRRIEELRPAHTLVLLDSDHAAPHVRAELELYSRLVAVGDPLLVQDGCIDELRLMRASRPGPLVAIKGFLADHPEYVVDEERSDRYLFSHSPRGWLTRIA
ncbi:MAG: CmcI family methyltransferase [Acidimicrobiales bacterium]